MRRRNVAYIRVATKENDAVDVQKKLIDYYAKEKNIKIDYYYVDAGYSGNNLDRPQLRQMLRDVKSKKITDSIIFKDCSRLSRNYIDLSKIINQVSNCVRTLQTAKYIVERQNLKAKVTDGNDIKGVYEVQYEIEGNPKVSILIPVYNGEKFIRRCLKSVLHQSYTNYEVIIINDGSKDASVLSGNRGFRVSFPKGRACLHRKHGRQNTEVSPS